MARRGWVVSKLPLREEPEVHFMPMPPERWEQAGGLASIFHDEYADYSGDDCTYESDGGSFYIRATPSGNITVWWKA